MAENKREPRRFGEINSAAETLKIGAGTPQEINALFAAFARAADFDVRIVACNCRTFILFSPDIAAPFVISGRAIAVSVEGKWKYYDPGSTYLPAGSLPWFSSDTTSLIGDAKGSGELRCIIGTPAEANTRIRKAALNLKEDGTLEGDVEETYSGLWEAEYKDSMYAETPTKR